MTSQVNEPKWWEKTVEYQFVINNHKKFQLIAPLDGKHETGTSDVILGQGDKFILIEFKKDATSQKAEFEKFKKNNKSKSDGTIITELQKLKNFDCHFLVYAKLEQDKELYFLELIHNGYIDYLNPSCQDKKKYSYNEMIEKGKSSEEFLKYLDDLENLRIFDTSDGSCDCGGGGGSDFSNILVLDNKGNCQSLSAFKKIHLTPNPPKNTPSGYKPK
ncbi:hypothetical protein [Neisseria dumasiana]|nr:hypothetical protein [Neisseria dumasiana]